MSDDPLNLMQPNPSTASGEWLDKIAALAGVCIAAGETYEEAKARIRMSLDGLRQCHSVPTIGMDLASGPDRQATTTFDISGDSQAVTDIEYSRENVMIVDRSLEGAIFAALLDANMDLNHNPDATNRVTIPYVSGLFNTATGEWDEVLKPKLLEIPSDVKWDGDGTCLIDGILVYNRDFDKSGDV
jgi:hypothetical protein